MGKWGIAAAATGAGGTGAAGIYGAHHMGAFGGGGKTQTLGALMGNVQGEREKASYANECLRKIFQDGTIDSDGLTSLEPNFTWKNKSAETQACLVYSWEKKNKDGGYKGSKFDLVWALAKGDEGIAVYLTATVKAKDQLEFRATSYLFEKKEEGKWKATKKLGLNGGKNEIILSSEEWKTTFPKMGPTDGISSFSRKGVNSDYWYFLDSKGENIDPDQTPSHKSHWWKWNNSSKSEMYKLKDWSANFDVWWEYFFGKTRLDMQALMVTNPLLADWSGT